MFVAEKVRKLKKLCLLLFFRLLTNVTIFKSVLNVTDHVQEYK